MPARDTYVLHIYRGRAVRGWQWAARLEHLPGGESWRFTDPEALLAYLQAVVRAAERVEPPDTRAAEDVPEGVPQEGKMQDSG
jgi:hypothetical protein